MPFSCIVNRFLDRIKPGRKNQRQEERRNGIFLYDSVDGFLCVIDPPLDVDDPENRGGRGSGRENGSGCQTREGLPGQCRPVGSCFYQYATLETINQNRCALGRDHHGVCCPIRGYHAADEGNI